MSGEIELHGWLGKKKVPPSSPPPPPPPKPQVFFSGIAFNAWSNYIPGFLSYSKAYLNIWWRRMYGLKLTSCRRMYRCVRNEWQLCLVCVNSLITHLQLQKMSIIYQSVHVTITFQLLEMSSIIIPNHQF